MQQPGDEAPAARERRTLVAGHGRVPVYAGGWRGSSGRCCGGARLQRQAHPDPIPVPPMPASGAPRERSNRVNPCRAATWVLPPGVSSGRTAQHPTSWAAACGRVRPPR